ncbi:MAG TPA: DUF2061 domain-containing protein [Stellaceae bacterium]|nr:DUF2061 domain-containing protein [Stellaceae bacterium]
MKASTTLDLAVITGAALLEAALIPGALIGAAAVLAPRYFPMMRRQLQPLVKATLGGRAQAAPPVRNARDVVPPAAPKHFEVTQAVAKTITFRIVVTSLDFTVNYVVLGELAVAAGLSTFGLVAGPLFYLAHETAWNYLGPADTEEGVQVFRQLPPDAVVPAGWRGLVISRALAKTVTFRTIASAMDFTVNFVVVGELGTALLLSASGFVLGPFVYYGHEMVWDRFTPRKALPAPASA